jgi:hypothetical protein
MESAVNRMLLLLPSLVVVLLLFTFPTPTLGVWNFADMNAEEEKVESVLKHVIDGNNHEAPDAEYGVDISFPMQHGKVSTNYPWLPHNVDPSIPTPPEYRGMPINPLGDRQSAYDEFIQGCIKHFGKRGQRCLETENDRFAMSLRQPQSMQVCVSCTGVLDGPASPVAHPFRFTLVLFFGRTTRRSGTRRSKPPKSCTPCSPIFGRRTRTKGRPRTGVRATPTRKCFGMVGSFFCLSPVLPTISRLSIY